MRNTLKAPYYLCIASTTSRTPNCYEVRLRIQRDYVQDFMQTLGRDTLPSLAIDQINLLSGQLRLKILPDTAIRRNGVSSGSAQGNGSYIYRWRRRGVIPRDAQHSVRIAISTVGNFVLVGPNQGEEAEKASLPICLPPPPDDNADMEADNADMEAALDLLRETCHAQGKAVTIIVIKGAKNDANS